MAPSKEVGNSQRYSISPEATRRELRLCGFALLTHYLTMHQIIAEHVRLEPVELLILLGKTSTSAAS